jgi:hypothetical protein
VRETFDHAAFADFELAGAHQRAGCEACHKPSALPDTTGRRFGRASVLFEGKPGECATCHADVHAGMFDREREQDLTRQATCERCHDSERFDSEAARAFDHGGFTAFALEGAHRRISCAKCHAELSAPTADGRNFARVEQLFRGPYDRCSACHEDPHNGHFDRPGMPALLDGSTSCARCHSQESFDSENDGHFNHDVWTGFQLIGAHAQTACAACHTPGEAARASGRRLGRAAGNACQDCHADPHAGQFQNANRSNCADCHEPSRSFTDERFDHQSDSRFALDATHAKLACAACHLPQTLPSGARVVRYKPLGTSCVDCHGLDGKGKGG